MTSPKMILGLFIIGTMFHFSTAGCAFHATLSTILTDVPLNGVVKFDEAPVNTCNGYNTLTGKFQAPRSGLYVFSWTILAPPGKFSETLLVVNGTIKGGARSNASNMNEYLPASTTVIVWMEEGDYAWIKPKHQRAESIYKFWSSFSGFTLP